MHLRCMRCIDVMFALKVQRYKDSQREVQARRVHSFTQCNKGTRHYLCSLMSVRLSIDCCLTFSTLLHFSTFCQCLLC